MTVGFVYVYMVFLCKDRSKVGDCWLVCALSALAAHPEKLKSLFGTKHIPEDGKYQIWLYDLYEKKWVQVEIDEFLPCTIESGRPVPTFARPLGNELWVMLIEKALAKFCGSYGKLHSGYPSWAFQVLTGKADYMTFLKEKSGWKKCKPQQLTKEEAKNPRLFKMKYAGWGAYSDLFVICLARGKGFCRRSCFWVFNVTLGKKDYCICF